MHILMQISDGDRRDLAFIIRRWHEIGPELKKAVLAVVSSGSSQVKEVPVSDKSDMGGLHLEP